MLYFEIFANACCSSHFYILREELWLFDEAALLIDHLVDFELCDAVGDRSHAIVNLLLADIGERAVNCFTVTAYCVLI